MKVDLKQAGFMTQAIHAGEARDPAYGAHATPIYQTSTFCFASIEEGMAKFDQSLPGYIYSRGGNPTVRVLEEKISALEGGEDCIVTSSGMGAISSVLLGLLSSGDHVVVGSCVYGCTNVAFTELVDRFGIEITRVDTLDAQAVAAAIRPNTKLVYFESLTNPTMELTDIGAVKKAVGEGIRVVVDNTFTPPPLRFPLQEGADIVVHSVTKYLNGHGDVVAGAIVGSASDMAIIQDKAATKLCGCTCSAFDAYLVIRGMQTLGLRMERHCANAFALARYLDASPYVERVNYNGLESAPQHDLAERQTHGYFGGILSFVMKDGIRGLSAFEAGVKVANAMKIAAIAVSLGSPSSLIEHPASMTHFNVPADERVRMGIEDGLIRFSVGLEDIDDLIADFDQAFHSLDAE